VLGGARSGKSAFAERLAGECGEPVLYVATASAGDAEMAARIALHRAARPAGWRTVEIATGLAEHIRNNVQTVLVEDLTLLLSNLMAQDEGQAEARAVAEVHAVLALEVHAVIVSNEVGMGIVPPYPLGRLFRDALGRLNQSAAVACGEVYLLVAGLPLQLK
jgi:adenosylcobinamide kinase / adenosylcobinamide-phosphate guanylyltransferase